MKKARPVSSVVRRSIVVPRRLVEEMLAEAPSELRANWNRLVRTALEHFRDELRERRIDEAILEMGRDPRVLAECRRINDELGPAEVDGLRP
jgi:hypothetical protein